MTFSYDAVAYPGHPFAQTHPDRLAAMAALCGLPFPPVKTCRVLELACGDGGNLVPLAVAFPEARFTGIDLATKPIAHGLETIAALNLHNIHLHAGDIQTIDRTWGEFDYIITHGLYSWSPEEVRENIMRISKENLASEGVAYISYNALPGGRIRQAMREMMLFHAGDFDDPQERVEQARALLGFVATARSRPDAFSEVVNQEVERMRARETWALFHDELADIYEPVYFHQFIEHAERHGLQYLGEAELSDMNEAGLTAEAIDTLNAIAGDDRILREQYADLAKCRRFRQTLLCHDGRKVDFPPLPERLTGLFASTTATRIAADEFAASNGARMKTEHPQARAMLDALIAAAPQAVSVAELQPDLEVLLATSLTGLTDLHTAHRPLTTAPGATPTASALVRYQLGGDGPVTTLHHATLNIEDATDRTLLKLLDGAHTCSELSHFSGLEDRLERFAKFGLLIA